MLRGVFVDLCVLCGSEGDGRDGSEKSGTIRVHPRPNRHDCDVLARFAASRLSLLNPSFELAAGGVDIQTLGPADGDREVGVA